MPMMPVVSQQKFAGESHQYFDQTGRMLVADRTLDWTREEYQSKVITTVRGCFGVFDTSQPDQLHFSRTFGEVLSNLAAGQFGLAAPPMYRWVQCKKHGVRPLVFIQWVEYRHMPRADAKRLSRQGAVRYMSGT